MRHTLAGLFLLFALVLTGCGGGSSTPPVPTTPFSLEILWPERNREVRNAPSSAYSVVVTLKNAALDGSDAVFSFNRVLPDDLGNPTSQTYTSPTPIRFGEWTLTVRFFAGKDSTGDLVGIASGPVTVLPNGYLGGTILTESIAASVTIVPGQRFPLARPFVPLFTVRDAQNNLMAVSPDSAKFNVNENSPREVYLEGGKIVGLVLKPLIVTATVDGKVSPPETIEMYSLGLAATPWAKYRGDASNTASIAQFIGAGIFSGTVKWRLPSSSSFENAGPGVVGTDGAVLLNTPQGLNRFNPTDGTRLSIVTPMQTFPPAVGIDGTLYVVGRPSVSDGRAYALNEATGEVKWTFAPPDTLTAPPALSVTGELCLVSHTHLYVLDSQTGAQLWQKEIADARMPTIGADGTLYVAAGSTVTAYAPISGTQKWTIDLGTTGLTIPVINEGGIYVGGADGILRSLGNGSVAWQRQMNSPISQLATAVNVLFVGTTDGKVWFVDRLSNRRVTRLVLDQGSGEVALTAGWGVRGGVVFVAAGSLYRLDETGQIQWQIPGNFHQEPIVTDDNTLIIAVPDGIMAVQ